MICVSYTRTVSEKKELPTIPEQNRMIADFVKKKGLAIEKKYSDRKQDPEAEDGFSEMKEDGISRKYDCVVFLSLDSFGKNLLFGYDLLSRAFVPAGIHFISVKDQFCSFEKSRKEIEFFLSRRLRKFRDDMHPITNDFCRGVKREVVTKYGYLRVEGENRLIIDPVSEPVVREIFKYAAEGMTYSGISKLLHEKGTETSNHRVNELSGRTTNEETDRWRDSTVRRILHDRVYSGRWKTRVDGKVVILDCPAYLSAEEQDEILAQYDKRTNNGRTTNLLSGFVFDIESGELLQPRQSGRYENRMVYLFFDPRKNLKTRSIMITFPEMAELVVKRIQEEKEAAHRVIRYLAESNEGKVFQKNTLTKLREKAKTIFDVMRSAAFELPVCEEILEDEKTELIDRLSEQYAAISDEFELLQKQFSPDNPWITLYSSFDRNAFTTSKMVGKYLDGVYCDRYGNIDIRLKEQKNRNVFPMEVIMGEERNGEKE